MKKRALYVVITIILFMTTLNICIRQSVSTTLAEWEVGKAFVSNYACITKVAKTIENL